MKPSTLALLLASLLALPPAARAERASLEVDWAVDGAITLVAGASWLGTELGKGTLAPSSCRWCARNGLDDGVTEALAWGSPKSASTMTDVLAWGAFPALTLAGLVGAGAADGRLREAPADALLVLEAVTVSSMLSQIVKFSVGRERPLAAKLAPGEKGSTPKPEDNNLSFYSAHSNIAFTMAVSLGTVAQLRGYRAAPVIWAVGLPLAAFVAYGRIAAEKHYLSDVLVGAAMGSAAGFLVPWLHRNLQPTVTTEVGTARLSLAPNGLALTGTFH